MTLRWIAAVAAAAAASLLGGVTVAARQGAAGPPQPALAVKVVGGPGTQFPVLGPPDGGTIEMHSLNVSAGPKGQEPAPPPPPGVKIQALMEGGAVRIKVSVVTDDSEPADAPGPKYGRREKPVASYLAKEGETVTVRELRDYGMDPLTLKVVRADPSNEAPREAASIPPLLVSEVKSVEVVGTWPHSSYPNAYWLSVRNAGAKSIAALEIHEAEGGRREGEAETIEGFGPHRPLLAPGTEFKRLFHVGDGCTRTPQTQGCIPNPQKQHTFVVGTAVFDDGTYEGEVAVAAGVEAERAGRRIQRGRVAALLKEALDAPAGGEAAALARFEERVSSLRIDADPAAVNEVLVRYPSLTGEEQKLELTRGVISGLRDVREQALGRVKEFGGRAGRGADGGEMRAWLSRLLEEYEAATPSR